VDLVEIYNFSLELVHSFEVDEYYNEGVFAVHGYDMLFHSPKSGLATIINYKNKSLSEKKACLYNEKKKINHADLFNFNERFIILTDKHRKTKTLYFYDRADFKLLYKAKTNSNSIMMMFDFEFYLFHENQDGEIKIYTAANSDNLKEVGVFEDKKKLKETLDEFMHARRVDISDDLIYIKNTFI
jgi:hypothetical protein